MNAIVNAVRNHAQNMPDRMCIADGRGAYTYSEFWNVIAGYAGHLETLGVGKDTCVLIRNSQDKDFMTAVLAVQLLGGISVPVEKQASPERMQQICEETAAVCSLMDFKGIPEETRNALPHAEEIKLAGTFANVMGDRADQLAEAIDENAVAEILFSTGTTGKSKGIVLAHSSVVAVSENVIGGVEMKADNVEMIPVPLSHSHGLRRTYSNLLNGSSVVLADGTIFAAKIFKAMDEYHVTAMDLVPSALSVLFKVSGDKLGDWKDQIDYVQLGSAPIPQEDRERLKRLLPNSRLYNFYGTTESGCSCILDFNDGVERQNCIGKPTVHSHFAFFTEDGQKTEATPENPGLLGCSGEMNMNGYFNRQELNDEAFVGDYIVTQDLSYQGEDGMIYLLGRQGDVIMSGGSKIAPDEVEEAANTMPGILESACVPVPDQILGQAVKLFYVTEKNTEVDEKEIIAYLKSKLEGYKVPKVLEKIDQIPRTYNGKIQRKALRERK